MKTAIFLGAGASKAEGAPMQNELFVNYFSSVAKQSVVNAPPNSPLWMKKELSEFFNAMFEIELPKNDKKLKKLSFPTFEEALGLLDLAESRREAFKDYDLDVFGPAGNRIRLVRQFMVLAMAKAIDDSLKHSKRLHQQLVRNLKQRALLKHTIFISTNYDILIDNAISALSPARPGINLDYGVEFTNFKEGDRAQAGNQPSDVWFRPAANAVGLYKLHGSLNWLYCAICNTLTLTPHQKGVIDLITDVAVRQDRAICRACGSIMTPIIIPPTFYKDMSRVFLSVIWNKAENVLNHVNHVIFCGYSFPDADMHIKYLLKRIQVNSSRLGELRFTVLNNHPGKRRAQVKDEKARYLRFLGSAADYTEHSFEEFVKNPEKVY